MTEKQKQDAALSELETRLQSACDKESRPDGPASRGGPQKMSGIGLATRIGVELVTTTLVGAALGWFLDDWLGTRPLLMIVFMLFGGAAGVSNVYRVVKGLDDGVGLGRAMRGKHEKGQGVDVGRGPDEISGP